MKSFPDATSSTPGGPQLRVQHVPGEHPYVRHLQPPTGHDPLFAHLPDPTPRPARGGWRPSTVLDPRWVSRQHGKIDVVHLHFGYEHLTAEQVTEWADAVHAAGVALVLTVHDIDNPHLTDQRHHHRNLAAALAAADEVITLTPGAAAEIRRRWGRAMTATVIRHPHIVPLELVGTRSTPRSRSVLRLGVPLGTLRANIDAVSALIALEKMESSVAPVQVTVRIARSAFSPDAVERADSAVVEHLRRGSSAGRWDVDVVEPALPEKDVWRWLSGLDALVLPYSHGTHSAWVEACADVGTSVIAPDLGHWGDQHPLLVVPRWRDVGPEQWRRVLTRLNDPKDPAGGGVEPMSADTRARERLVGHRRHAQIYRTAL